MNPETWNCQNCGEEIEAQFDMCWNCETPKYSPTADIAEGFDTEHGNTSPERVLAQILDLQKAQKNTLRDIQSKVGCLYAYMILGIAVGLMAVLKFFSR